MPSVSRPTLGSLLLALVAHAPAALAADPDTDADALSLVASPAEAPAGAGATSLFVEAAAGGGRQQSGSGWQSAGRLTVDLNHSMRIAPNWHAVISDRVDAVHPAIPGTDPTVNSLREAYVSWQRDDASTLVDLGRVNLRYGPAYGYNPTDFFRDNSLRVVTTADPLALRQDRLGVFALRGQQAWGDSTASLTYAPKLANQPSTEGANLDAGATNDRGRALLTFSTRFSDRIGGQLLVYKEDSLSPQVGASTTALLSDAVVGFAEASRGREPSLLERVQGLAEPRQTRNRIAAGLTVTPTPKLSITGEYEYNGFALDRAGLRSLGNAGPAAAGGYVYNAIARQDNASRDAWFAYATLKDAGMRNLDATALLRVNANDHSDLGWLELRYHWSKVDAALQVQAQRGGPTTEYGLIPYRRLVQLVATYHLF